MMKRLALAFALFAMPAAAQVAISGLPAASALSGTELVPIVQGGVTSKTTASAISTYMAGIANSWAANQTFAAGTTAAAPLILQSGANLTLPRAGAIEWDGSNLYATQTTGPTRKTILFSDLSNISGTLAILNGGTGATTAGAARTALGAAALAGATFTGEVVTPASATGSAGLNLPHGTAPTSPVNGDFWTTTGGAFARINGATVSLGVSSGWSLISTQTASGSASLSWSSISTGFTDLKLVINGLTCPSNGGQTISFTDTNSATTSIISSATTGTTATWGEMLFPSWNANSVLAIGTWGAIARPSVVQPSQAIVVFNSTGTIATISIACASGNIGVGSASLYGR